RDLHHCHRPVRTLDDEAVALILLAGLIEIRIEKTAGPMLDQRNATAHGRAVYVAGKDIHEDGNARGLRRAKAELGGWAGPADGRYDAVCRRDYQPVVQRRGPRGITEKIGTPCGKEKAYPEERFPQDAEDDGADRECCDKAIALPVDGHECVSDCVG